ncbi:MAG: TerB family tellurite resistance protein [Rhodoplanes sp.]|uniref:tellurite resistance TerB family protein n=1 Tax=Rhodoplanes sp. TaxID=1968906 RepID=UPI001826F7F9|nr:TerB family tellurite resistance protein [Rhodoplanes sp.]NVO16575.1 TerB family tellurite resistance protein [Rhodoplanes sp.]
MFNDIKVFLAELTSGGKHPARFEANDYRLAAAALMVHVATLDANLSDVEREKLHTLLKTRFALDDATTDELIDAAVAADNDAVDFYQFTSLLMRSLDEDGRRKVVAMMWEMVFADGDVTEFEDNVMWRVADLLAVPNRERIELKREVAEGRDPLDDPA